jgi:uncharacterized protein YndB with AHSA1/START domain
MSKNI